MTLLDDGTVHDIQGRPTLLMHGDVLCTDDVAYQAVRQQVRDPQWQAQILAMPLEARRAFAAKAREDSRAHTGSTMETHHGRQRRRRGRQPCARRASHD